MKCALGLLQIFQNYQKCSQKAGKGSQETVACSRGTKIKEKIWVGHWKVCMLSVQSIFLMFLSFEESHQSLFFVDYIKIVCWSRNNSIDSKQWWKTVLDTLVNSEDWQERKWYYNYLPWVKMKKSSIQSDNKAGMGFASRKFEKDIL